MRKGRSSQFSVAARLLVEANQVNVVDYFSFDLSKIISLYIILGIEKEWPLSVYISVFMKEWNVWGIKNTYFGRIQ